MSRVYFCCDKWRAIDRFAQENWESKMQSEHKRELWSESTLWSQECPFSKSGWDPIKDLCKTTFPKDNRVELTPYKSCQRMIKRPFLLSVALKCFNFGPWYFADIFNIDTVSMLTPTKNILIYIIKLKNIFFLNINYTNRYWNFRAEIINIIKFEIIMI